MLGPGGEFGFVIIALATGEHLLSDDVGGDVLLITALTMAAIPLLSALGGRLSPRAAPSSDRSGAAAARGAGRHAARDHRRVRPCRADGGGLLEDHRIPYVAIDHDPDRVARERRQGRPVYYGDVTQIELLRHLHLQDARALVVTLDEPAVTDGLVAAARAERSDLLIVVRARDARHAAHLYRTGASDAVPETIEASLQLSEAVLVDLGIPMGPVLVSIHEKRAALQEGIKAMAPQAEVRSYGGRRLRDAKPG